MLPSLWAPDHALAAPPELYTRGGRNVATRHAASATHKDARLAYELAVGPGSLEIYGENNVFELAPPLEPACHGFRTAPTLANSRLYDPLERSSA
jgi:hypothetical protein